MGHSTWDTWSAMTKLHKHYDFALHLPAAAAGARMSFSSYPGACLPHSMAAFWALTSLGTPLIAKLRPDPPALPHEG